MGEKTFRSRLSTQYIILFGALLFLGWHFSKIEGLLIVGSCVVFSVFAFRSLYYVLTDKEIEVYYLWGIAGKPFGRFFISTIDSVERSYSPVSCPAASAKRLRFRFKRGCKWHLFFNNSLLAVIIMPMISPVREQEFLEGLKAINPEIHIDINDKKGLWWRFWGWDIC